MGTPAFDDYEYDTPPLEPVGEKYVYNFPRPSVTTDIAVFHIDSPEQYITNTYVLLIKRGDETEACAGMWALPGGYMEIDETLRVAASRELFEETGITVSSLSLGLVGIYDGVNRDARGRVLTVAYAFEIYDRPEVKPNEREVSDYRWVNVLEDIINDEYAIELAFDHRKIIRDAYNKLRG